MQKGLLTKIIFVVALLIFAGFSLYPTFQFGGLQQKESVLFSKIQSATGLSKSDIETSLLAGNLETRIRDAAGDKPVDAALESARSLSDLNKTINNVERKAIKQGLDLQGGTYLVYEADLPQLLKNLAKNQDDRLNEIIVATQKTVEEHGTDFFTVLDENFKQRDIELNRYFGRKGESNDKVIESLRKEAEDAVDRTLEVLRNRIDQFGVSEPMLTKQGTNRIVIELAGIQSIQRARNVISSTALLEFKLVQQAEMVWSVMDDIDRVMRAKQKGLAGKDTTALAAAETAKPADGTQAKEQQVSLSELFGEEKPDEQKKADEKIVVDQNTFSDRPFTSMLRQLQGRNFIAVPQQNVFAVQRVLQLPEVKSVIPSDAEFLFSNEPLVMGEEQFVRLYMVKKEPELLGEMLSDASVQISSGGSSLNSGAPYVSMELNNEGAKIFSKVTGMNIGRELAIVLDGKVASAPVIESKIPNGSAMIEGTYTMDQAKDLALILRAGALPAPLYAITENTVGPSLGQDSIQKGQFSAVLGFILVILYMLWYYKWSGLIADFALLFNIVFIFAVMAAFHSTLTLPGIAGIILTLGMAVDANVLIFERIREEIRSGKTIRASIDAGYGRAFVTILDANVTTLISSVVLYSFGTGPIKGFALTLSIGIIVSMFTAIFVSRLVYDFITTRFAIKKLSI
jgi:SecD/SecF fusion protein